MILSMSRRHFGVVLLSLVAAIAVVTVIAHMSCIYLGPSCFSAQLAPVAIVESAKEGTWLAPIGTLVVSSVFLLCALYVLSAAKLMFPVPMLRLGIIVISCLCIFRGIATIPMLAIVPEAATLFAKIAGVVWFSSGLSCALGYYLVQSSEPSE